MKKQSYHERVQALAEKMAANRWDNDPYRKGEDFNKAEEDIRVSWINEELINARISVADTVEAIQTFAAIHGSCTMGQTEQYLKEQGLIPNDGQGVGRKIVNLTCENCGTKWQGEEPKMCCNGTDCGCMGLPVDGPICCDEKCFNELMVKLNQNNGQEAGSDD